MPLRHRFAVDGRELFVIDDFLQGARLAHLTTYFDFAPAQRIEADRVDTDGSRFWIVPLDRDTTEQQPHYRELLQVAGEHFHGESFTLERAYCNVISYGDMLYRHRDSSSDGDVTALVFLCESWEAAWGGETIFFDAAGDAVHAVSPRPGRLVLFRSSIEHRAGSPTRVCNRTRLTLAFKLRRAS
ncbi:MAG TPA: 2OG-Fe(II) oxygenase [Thermoanaerobaculia bacterium]|nr:2OG-Fe(II) oxygenase [Thermoanaerobaculia bacterium]